MYFTVTKKLNSVLQISLNKKYHSGTICKGVSNPHTSNALSGCEKEEIPK